MKNPLAWKPVRGSFAGKSIRASAALPFLCVFHGCGGCRLGSVGKAVLQVGFSGIVIKIIPLPVLPDDLHSDFIRSKQTGAALHRHRFAGGDAPGEVGKS